MIFHKKQSSGINPSLVNDSLVYRMLRCIDDSDALVEEGPGVLAAAIMRISIQEEQINQLTADDKSARIKELVVALARSESLVERQKRLLGTVALRAKQALDGDDQSE